MGRGASLKYFFHSVINFSLKAMSISLASVVQLPPVVKKLERACFTAAAFYPPQFFEEPLRPVIGFQGIEETLGIAHLGRKLLELAHDHLSIAFTLTIGADSKALEFGA